MIQILTFHEAAVSTLKSSENCTWVDREESVCWWDWHSDCGKLDFYWANIPSNQPFPWECSFPPHGVWTWSCDLFWPHSEQSIPTSLSLDFYSVMGLVLTNEILADIIISRYLKCVGVIWFFPLYFCHLLGLTSQGSCSPFSFGLKGTHIKQTWAQPAARSQDHLEPLLKAKLSDKPNLYQLNRSPVIVKINA